MKNKKTWSIVLAFMAVLSLQVGNSKLSYADDFDNLISPISNPVNFEDPRSLTEIRPIYVYHSIDDKFITQGGSVQLWALQLRYAIDDRLSVIATKDGYVVMKLRLVRTKFFKEMAMV